MLPDFTGNDSGIIPIELITSRELVLEISPEERVERPAEVDQKRHATVSNDTLVDRTVVKRRMDELSLGESLRLPSPDVLLPKTQEVASEEERIKWFLTSPSFEGINRAFQESIGPSGTYKGVRPPIDVSSEILKDQKVEVDPATELVLTRLKSITEESSREKDDAQKLGVKGPIARRELTYVPPIPIVKANIETEFEMKFWVRPNGTVDRVIPVKRAGDVELERVATNYLRRWRFKAIPESQSQTNEWGTVVIKFRLE